MVEEGVDNQLDRRNSVNDGSYYNVSTLDNDVMCRKEYTISSLKE